MNQCFCVLKGSGKLGRSDVWREKVQAAYPWEAFDWVNAIRRSGKLAHAGDMSERHPNALVLVVAHVYHDLLHVVRLTWGLRLLLPYRSRLVLSLGT